MIFVGDGYTDIPCFSLIRRSGGVAFGVWDPRHRDKRIRAWGFIQEGRVSNLNQARSDEQAELYHWLQEAVESLACPIPLPNRLFRGYGGSLRMENPPVSSPPFPPVLSHLSSLLLSLSLSFFFFFSSFF